MDRGEEDASKGADDEAFSGLPIPAKGTVLLGKYKVEGVVGIGGMGMVIAARHEHLNERVALKLLLPRYAELPEIRKRFQREAQAAYKLRSEHVCRVLDAGELEDGTPFIAMEFLKGDDLAAMLRKRKRIPAAEAVDFVLQACDALGEAHANEVVHRDLKPANLVVITRKDGTPCLKVIDFGISKISNETSDLTNTYGYLGSPSYSAPEQFASTRAMTASGDIWALGVILYEMVCGKAPFDFSGDSLAEMATTITYEPAVPMTTRDPSIDRNLDRVVLKCLEKEPANRHARVRELAEALAPFASAPIDDLLGRLRRHQGGPLRVAPSESQPHQALSGGTSVVPGPSTAPVSTLDYRQPQHPSPQQQQQQQQQLQQQQLQQQPTQHHLASQPPMPPQFMTGPLVPPQGSTRYAVVAEPRRDTQPPTAARRNTWIPAALAALAVMSSVAAVVLYRGSRHPKTTDPVAASAVLEPVSMGTAPPATDPLPSAAVIVAVPASAAPSASVVPTASAAIAASAVRPTPTTRPAATGRTPHHGPATPATAATPAATVESGPKILKDRDGKF